ncbi:pilus assembly protein PilE [Pseudomonas oryzihabitans]|nr:pilus assembly protein PilE [Pseudomonas psychrotolerans]
MDSKSAKPGVLCLTRIRNPEVAMRARGFTLIELMITVAIVGILAGIAYPSYQSYVLRSHRSEGQALLNEAAARMERYYAQNNAYTNKVSDLNIVNSKTAAGSQTVLSPSGYYELSLATNAAGSAGYTSDGPYVLTAQPKGTQANDVCGNLSLNAQGVKKVSKGEVTDCWR